VSGRRALLAGQLLAAGSSTPSPLMQPTSPGHASGCAIASASSGGPLHHSIASDPRTSARQKRLMASRARVEPTRHSSPRTHCTTEPSKPSTIALSPPSKASVSVECRVPYAVSIGSDPATFSRFVGKINGVGRHPCADSAPTAFEATLPGDLTGRCRSRPFRPHLNLKIAIFRRLASATYIGVPGVCFHGQLRKGD
jgi:hypothetical protein